MFNAVLQALFHSDQLCSEVLSVRPSPSRPHLAALQRVFAFLAFSQRPAHSPVEFQRAALPPWFKRGRQNDCSEFLMYLLDAMHEEERASACLAIPAAPTTIPLLVQPAVTPCVWADTSEPGPAAADGSRSRRRHRLCHSSPGPGEAERPSLITPSDPVSDDRTMAEVDVGKPAGCDADDGAQPAEDNGSGHDGSTRTGNDSDARTDPDKEHGTGGTRIGAAGERTSGGSTGAGDSCDVTAVGVTDDGDDNSPGEPAGLVSRLLAGCTETTYTCCACGSVSRHEEQLTDMHLALPELVTRPLTAAARTDRADSLLMLGPEPRPAGSEGSPMCPGPELETQADAQQQHRTVPVAFDVQPKTHLTVPDLLEHYLAPERLSGQNQYHCARCACLRDADRQVRLLTPPLHLVISLLRFGFDRRTGARRKLLEPVSPTERLAVPLVGRQPAQYRLCAVIVHAGHSLDVGHYFSFCRVSGDDSGGCDGADVDWWRLDDASATPVTAATVLGRPRCPTETTCMLLYRLAGEAETVGRPQALATLPVPLREAVDRDNAEYRRERQACGMR